MRISLQLKLKPAFGLNKGIKVGFNTVHLQNYCDIPCYLPVLLYTGQQLESSQKFQSHYIKSILSSFPLRLCPRF
jgi:hypothetical protein